MAKPVVTNPGGLMNGFARAMGFSPRSDTPEEAQARGQRVAEALQRVNASIDMGGPGFGGYGYLPPQNLMSKLFSKRESARRALMRDLGYLMSEARWLAKYHPIVRQAIRIREYWTVGSGLNHKFRYPKRGWTIKQKAAFEDAVVKGFLESPAMDKNRKCNAWMLDGLIQRTIDVSGSIVIVHRKIKIAEMRRRGLKIPLMVEQYEPDMIWLGTPPRGELRNGETFRDGYAFDANDDPVALFLCSKHPSEGAGVPVRMDLYDREGNQQVFHLFDPDRAGHLHGTPIAVSVVEIASDGADWWKSRTDRAREEAKVTRYVKMGADVGAPVTKLFSQRYDDAGEPIPLERSDEETPAVNMTWDEAEGVASNIAASLFGNVDNNSVPFMPNDWSIEAGQLSPSSDFGTYWKEIVRMIASGMDVPNSLAANDTSGGSFSADKIGLTNLKIGSRKRQLYLAYAWRAPLYAAAMRAAMAIALIPNDEVQWDTKADPFPVIEPEREANAAVTLMDAGLETWEDIVTERGHDPDEQFEKIKRQIERFAEIGVDMRPGSIKAKGGGAASSTAGQGDDTNAGVDKAGDATDDATDDKTEE